jgi:integrase/recombinase XerD
MLSNEYTAYLKSYRDYLTALGYVYHSQRSRTVILREFLQWLINQGLNDITQVKPSHIKEYHEQLKNRPCKNKEGVLSSGSVQHHFFVIRLFFALLQEKHIIIKNPMSVVKFTFPKEKKQPKAVLTIAEAMELYRHSETLSERAFLSLCYGCGLRSMELSAINIDDLRLNENYIIIPSGKGNRKRLIPINQRIRADIEQYINHERDLYLKDKQQKSLLLTTSGERTRAYTFRRILRDIIKRTGNRAIIKKKICPHHLRHSIATHLLERGVGVEQVRNFLGHANLETTEIYTRVSQKQLQQLL